MNKSLLFSLKTLIKVLVEKCSVTLKPLNETVVYKGLVLSKLEALLSVIAMSEICRRNNFHNFSAFVASVVCVSEIFLRRSNIPGNTTVEYLLYLNGAYNTFLISGLSSRPSGRMNVRSTAISTSFVCLTKYGLFKSTFFISSLHCWAALTKFSIDFSNISINGWVFPFVNSVLGINRFLLSSDHIFW